MQNVLPLLAKEEPAKKVYFFFSLNFVLEYSVAQRLIHCSENFRYPTFSNFLRQLGEKLVCQSILWLQHSTVQSNSKLWTYFWGPSMDHSQSVACIIYLSPELFCLQNLFRWKALSKNSHWNWENSQWLHALFPLASMVQNIIVSNKSAFLRNHLKLLDLEAL